MNSDINEDEAARRFKKVDQYANNKYVSDLLTVTEDEILTVEKIKEISDKLISIGEEV